MAYYVFFIFSAANFSCKSLFSMFERSMEFAESLLMTESLRMWESADVFFSAVVRSPRRLYFVSRSTSSC